ncbi:MAG: anti-sigma factor domain-containing protein, partial [Phycisphaerales bacterium JB040]
AAVLLGGLALTSWWASGLRSQRATLEDEAASLRAQIEENELLLDGAEARLASIRMELEATQGLAEERLMDLAAAEQTRIAMARRLSEITSELDRAELEIARYETPVDPEVLAENRRKLLEVPDTVRVAWQPFSLADAPPEQAGEVSGDVVWNDELQRGFLRFVGLRPNDPATEQYQVWIIDERGMEQKVSGGVFNATARGEVIVPLEPGIDVGRVALFAVTIEEPGGTWVPSLDRRVVVAPREEG